MGSVVGEFRTAIAVVAPLLVGVAVVTLLVAGTTRRRRVVATLGAGLFAGGMLLIGAATLLPSGAGHATGTNLTPFSTMRTYLDHGDPVLTVRNLLLNVALFVPAATGLVTWRRMAAWPAVLGGVVVSVLVEALQWALPLGRTADVDDVLLNSVGAFLGAVAATFARAAARGDQRRRLSAG